MNTSIENAFYQCRDAVLSEWLQSDSFANEVLAVVEDTLSLDYSISDCAQIAKSIRSHLEESLNTMPFREV